MIMVVIQQEKTRKEKNQEAGPSGVSFIISYKRIAIPSSTMRAPAGLTYLTPETG